LPWLQRTNLWRERTSPRPLVGATKQYRPEGDVGEAKKQSTLLPPPQSEEAEFDPLRNLGMPMGLWKQIKASRHLDERLAHELAAEKAAQIEGAKVVLKPLVFIVAFIVFALCFWRYDLGLVLSIGAAILVVPIMGLGVALPIGYVLGKRAARRAQGRAR
jgi:hypothetical protein